MTMIIWSELALGVLVSFAMLAQTMSRQAILQQQTVVARRASTRGSGQHLCC